MKKFLAALLVSLCIPGFSLAQSARSAPAAESGSVKYFPLSEVKPGLKGYGLTVFEGNKIDRFDVEVLGVLDGMPNPKQSIIIARLGGEQVARTKVFQGMSGSPVYIDGKMVGAVAYAFGFSTEAIAGITPIGQMVGLLQNTPAPNTRVTKGDVSFRDLVAARGTSAAAPSDYLSHIPAPLAVPGTSLAAASPQLAAYAGQSLQPIATPLAFGGIPQSVIDMFAPQFARLGLHAGRGRRSREPDRADVALQ